MNRSYRTVWNAALGASVAVSENTGAARGRARGSRRSIGARTVLAGAAALAVGTAAQAATFTASDEASLNLAIAGANGSTDPASSIVLTSNVTVGTALFPVLAGNVSIVPNGFTLSTSSAQKVDVGAGASLMLQGAFNGVGDVTKVDAGSLVFAGAASKLAGNLNVNSGEVRFRDGATLDMTGSSWRVSVNGDNAHLVATGNGTAVTTGSLASSVGSAAGATLDVLAGASFQANSGLFIGSGAGTIGTLTAQDKGTTVVAVGGLSSLGGHATVRVLDGAVVTAGSKLGARFGGTAAGTNQGGVADIVVSGAGSALVAPAGFFLQQSGTLEVSKGASVQAQAAVYLGPATAASFTGVVTGSGSTLASTNQVIALGAEGAATLTVADGGTISAAGGKTMVTLAGVNGTGNGSATLNIGAAVGAAAAAPGTVIASAVHGGGGTAVLNFNHNAADYDFATPITGSTSVNHVGSGTTTLVGANTYAGDTQVAAGTLRAGAASVLSATSAHTVAAGGTLDLAGFQQTLPSLANAGTVSLPGSQAGNTLTVTGAYVGNGGTLRLGTSLGDSSSASDRLVLSGASASASGRTQVQITNLGGLGALTTGNGIEVISATGGATTTAQTTRDAFRLAGDHVDAGAYEYRLYAADASGAGENWYLRSTAIPVVVAPEPAVPGPAEEAVAATPSPAPVPLYRAEVPLYAVVPEQFREFDFAMLGNLHQRVGDERMASAGSSAWGNRQGWGRIISMDRDIAQQGTVSPSSSGRMNGFQAGTDLWANPNWRTGVYAGQLEGDMDVNGFARGVVNYAAGRNDLRSQYLGAYATWSQPAGTYVDGVLQAGRHRYTAYPALGQASSGKGDSVVASIEVGQDFAVAPRWTVEPQLQLAYQHLGLDDTSISGASIRQDIDNGWVARAGVRIKGAFDAGAGTLQPYARVNVYKRSSGTDITRFIGPAASTDIASRTGGTSSELALGATWQLGQSTSVYGELGKLWDLGGDARTGSGVNGSVGVKVLW